MKIHAICVAKDEADIIEQTLKAATHWCDFIYVFDNGSTDGTWEKVLDLSQEYKQIVPYKQDNCVYYNGLRTEVFHHFRSKAVDRDWWCQLDADEIYIDDPRIFLAKVPHYFQSVWAASFQYYFTEKDLDLYNQNSNLYADNILAEQKCRYYLNDWSEARFFRYDDNLLWDRNRRWPYTGAVYPVRIWLKHFQYRSPQQIKKRLLVRREARKKGSKSFQHLKKLESWKLEFNSLSQVTSNIHDFEQEEEKWWKKRIADSSLLNFDKGDRKYVAREDLMPSLPSANPFILNKTRNLKKYINRMTFQRLIRLSRKFKLSKQRKKS